MELLLAFAIVLLIGVSISGVANRTVLSTAVLFLAAGFLLGDGMLGVIALSPDDEIVTVLAELALFSVLFTDGQKIGLRDLRRAWRLPGRALLFGMPLTFVVTTVLAVFVVGLPWPEAMLVAAVLAPTDPVFASAIVGRKEIPDRLRSLLGVESGVNDGLALPVVLVLVAVIGGPTVDYGALTAEIAGGIALGVAVPAVAVVLLRSRFISPTSMYVSLTPVAVGLIVYALASLLHVNLYLAAFAAGITIATMAPELRDAFHEFGELVTELLKLLAILVFGALISPAFLGEIPLLGYVFALLTLVIARPAAIELALIGSGLTWPERATAAWFGPKGFASVIYGLIVLGSGGPRSDEMFHLIALAIVMSILAHSSTDVPIADYFARATLREERDSHADAAGTEVLPPTESPDPGIPRSA